MAIVFKPTLSMWSFMQSDAFIRVICGPIGSGKSTLCCYEMLKRAMEQKPNQKGERKFRGAIIRNTHQQLTSTTLKTWNDVVGEWGYWKASEKTFYIDQPLSDGTTLKAEFMALSFDEPSDVRRALSLELSACWFNEWREIAPEVTDGLAMRLRRYPSMRDGGPSWSGMICDTNGPDIDSFHYDKMEDPPANWAIFKQPPAILDHKEWVVKFNEDPPAGEEIIDNEDKAWWINPEADNLANLHVEYYPAVLLGKSKDFIDVYLRGNYGRSLAGLPVYDKTFNEAIHVAQSEFVPLKSAEYPVIVGLDLGRTPAASLMQRNAWGQVILLDELNSENMGIETFLTQKLTPMISQTKYLGCHFIVAPDPAGKAKQQIGEVSPVDCIRKAGYKVVIPITNDPEHRIMAVERLLTAPTRDSRPAFQINAHCKQRISEFRYGYKYALNKKGVQDEKPLKDGSSHGADSVQYGALVIEGNQLTGAYPGQTQRRDIKKVSYIYA